MKLALLFLLLAAPCAAQEVRPLADVGSYGTALVNPLTAAVAAWRSPSRGCRLARLALSEAIGNGLTIGLKRVLVSPRPCLGCAPDGMPSGHTMNSLIGASSSRWGFTASIATGALRHGANRHTWPQVLAGAAVGVGAEAAGRLVRCGG